MGNQFASPGVAITIERIGPQTAKEWLLHNTRNRDRSMRDATAYFMDMSSDDWHFTGEALVIFDCNGVLNNGQHFLTALSEMDDDYQIDVLVTRGVSPESQMFSDQGKKRTLGNLLTMGSRMPNANYVAAMARVIYLWDSELFFADHSHSRKITNVEVLMFMEQFPEIAAWGNLHYSVVRRYTSVPDKALASALYLIERSAPVKGPQFVDRFLSGTRLDTDLTLKALDRILSEMRLSNTTGDRDFMGTLFTGWNLWKTNKQRSNLRIPSVRRVEGAQKASPRWTEETFPYPLTEA